MAAWVVGAVGCGLGEPNGAPDPASSVRTPASRGTAPSATRVTGTGASATGSSRSGAPAVLDRYPAAARSHSDAGGRAFVSFYFDTINMAWSVPRTGSIAELSHRLCQFCRKTEARAKALKQDHQRYSSAVARLGPIASFGGAPRGQAYYAVTMHQLGARVVELNGSLAHADRRADFPFNAVVMWSGGRWLMYEVENQ